MECLQKILSVKEKENLELKESLRNRDIALRTEFIRMEAFADGVEQKYKNEMDRLEGINKQLQQRLAQVKNKKTAVNEDKFIFELTDD